MFGIYEYDGFRLKFEFDFAIFSYNVTVGMTIGKKDIEREIESK